MQGRIVKGIAGFYYIKIDNSIVECKARGKFRHSELTPMIGDIVEIEIQNGKGVIDKVYPRKNELIRPAVANVTQAFIVFSFRNPDLNLDLLNKILLSCEYKHLKCVICFNKLDLVQNEQTDEIVDILKAAGYEVVFIKAKEGFGLENLRERLKDNVTVLCGPSGVGKSTILNKLTGRNIMETGDLSEKVGRGKHTTRHSELIEINEGLLVDTPGFSSLDINYVSREQLQYSFPEFNKFLDKCKFTGCIHYKEPDCSVKDAVKNGEISDLRYDFYIRTLDEISSRRDKR